MSTHLVAVFLAAGLLLGGPVLSRAAAGQVRASSGSLLPPDSKLSEVEIRLAYESHGGCVGRCIKYRVVVHGTGLVEYEDLGGEPRDRPQRRTVAIDEVVSLVNEFVRARFLDAALSYAYQPVALLDGNSGAAVVVGGSVDGPEWDLTLRVGTEVKTVHFVGFPPEFRRLRDLVDQIGGPRAWAAK